MKRKKGYLLCYILIAIFSVFIASKQALAVTNYPDVVEINQKFIKLVNEERGKFGLSPLNYNPDLLPIAQKRAVEIKTIENHNHPSGTLPELLDEYNVSEMKYTCENLFFVKRASILNNEKNILLPSNSPVGVWNMELNSDNLVKILFLGWKKSLGHYSNMMNPLSTDEAVGVYYFVDNDGKMNILASNYFVNKKDPSNLYNSLDELKFPDSIKIDTWNPQMKVGEISIFNISSYPLKGFISADWSSSNLNVAKIDKVTGEITALNPGTTEITATARELFKGAARPSDKVTITVSDQNTINVSSVQLSPSNLSLSINETKTMNATILPSNASSKTGEWSSSNKSIVSVDTKTGLIKGINKGTAKIYFTSDDGKRVGTTTVTVTNKEHIAVEKALTRKASEEQVRNGNTISWEYVNTATNKIVEEINNGSIISIKNKDTTPSILFTDSSGKESSNQGFKMEIASGNSVAVPTYDVFDEQVSLRKLRPGLTKVKFISLENPNISTTLDVVIDDVSPFSYTTQSVLELDNMTNGFFISATNASTDIDAYKFVAPETGKYTFKVEIPSQDYKELSNSDLRIVVSGKQSDSTQKTNVKEIEVDLVKGNTYDAVVSLTSNPDKEIKYSITTTIPNKTNIKVSNISLDKSVINLKHGDSLTLNPTITPTNAYNKKISWSSSNNAIAVVDSKGVVTALRNGTVVITAKTADGNKAVSSTLTVSEEDSTSTINVDSVSLNATSASLQKGTTKALTATIQPSNATNKSVTWTSSNTNVATVNASGTVTAVNAGSATITAKTVDGNKTATCAITVTNPSVSVSGVSLNATSASLQKGTTKALIATVQPSNATNKNVTWSSSNTNVATVNAYGTVTAMNAGSATITVKTADGNKTATCAITVTNPGVSVSDVSLNATSASLQKGTTKALTATVQPSNATNKNVTWSSSNTNVATVNASGTVTAVNAGSATITAKTADGNKTATCAITVTNPNVSVSGVSLNATSASLQKGTTKALTATVQPSNATNKSVTWSSSNTNVATVNASGTVTAVNAGSATITAKTADGNKTAACAITVNNPFNNALAISENTSYNGTIVSGIINYYRFTASESGTYTIYSSSPTNFDVYGTLYNSNQLAIQNNDDSAGNGQFKIIQNLTKGQTYYLSVKHCHNSLAGSYSIFIQKPTTNVTGVTLNATSASLQKGTTKALTATIQPSNATNKSITWTSSNTNVATVNASGTVTAVNAGSATITAKTADGNKTATCAITVTNPSVSVSGVSLNATSASLQKGTTKALTATIQPSNATNKSVTWTSSNTNVATVNASGTVTAVNAGSATITTKTADGNKTAACAITVSNPLTNVKEIYLYPNIISLFKGDKTTVTPSINPKTASNKSVIWKSNNTSIASVSSTGVVTALNNGETTITATTVDGNFTCSATVQVGISKISFSTIKENYEYGFGTYIDSHNYYKFIATQTGEYTFKARTHWNPTIPLSFNLYDSNENLLAFNDIKNGQKDFIITKKLIKGNTYYIKTSSQESGWYFFDVISPYVKPQSVNLSPKSVTLQKGKQGLISLGIIPNYSTNKSVTWKSNNHNVATVDSSGKVTAIGTGTATITATTIDGGIAGSTTVSVPSTIDVNSITLNNNVLTLSKNGRESISATIQPSDATNKNVTWSSSNTNVATVNANGTVTAVNTGSATITAKTTDGNKTATCTITVK